MFSHIYDLIHYLPQYSEEAIRARIERRIKAKFLDLAAAEARQAEEVGLTKLHFPYYFFNFI